MKKIDSIKQIISITKSDSTKSVEYLTLSNRYVDKDSIFEYLTKSLYFARKAKIPKYISNSRVNFANWYGINVSRRRAIREHIDAINELEKFDFKSGIANHYIRLGYRYNTSNIDSTLLFLDKGVRLAKESKDDNVVVTGLMALGNVSFFKSELDKALDYYIEAEKICSSSETLKNTVKHANSLEYMGYIMERIKNFDKAMDYFSKSYEIALKLGFPDYIATMESNMAQQYMIKEDYKGAIPLLNKAISYYENFKVPDNRAISSYIKRGECYKHLDKFKEAERDYLKAVEIAKLPNNKKHYTTALYRLADTYLYFKDYKKAETYYREAEVLCKEEKNYEYLKIIYKGLAEIETQNKNYENVISLLKETIKNAELENQDKLNEAIVKAETEFHTQKKEKEIEVLSLKNDIAKKQGYYYIGLLVAVLIIVALIFLVFRNRIRSVAKEKELNKIKSHFLSNISHEFRTPLTLINGPLIKLLENKNLINEAIPELELIHKNTNRLIELVDQMLELSRLDAGVAKITVEKGDVESFLKATLDSFGFLEKEKKLKLNANIQTMGLAWFDFDALNKIVTNLFSNTFKYTPPFGEIDFEAFIKDGKELILSITNDTDNVKKEDINKLFERFYQGHHNQREGVGIGLSMVKELVDLMHGKIQTKIINDNKKINFIITVPITRESFASNDRAVILNDEEVETVFDVEKKPINKKTIVLVVDDNKSIREYIISLLKNEYEVLTSNDGKEAMDKAVSYLPDIVISDVMMPNIDGIELCKMLKEKELTSHIPLILLTAKSGDYNEISGLQSGADDYITKPFNPKTLLVKIKNIIDGRRLLQDRYKKDTVFKPKNIAVNSLDEIFLNKVKAILDLHLNKPDFNPDFFSRELGMSRMQLHRKIFAYTGLSTSNFISSQRLKQAAMLLLTSQYNVNEIAYTVGFSTPSYFIKCFKEMYGKTPLEYIDK